MSFWNAVRFDPARPPAGGHVESYFFKLNDPAGRRALWLKGTLLARRGAAPQAEAWAIAFDRDRGHRAAKETRSVGGAWNEVVSFSGERLAAIIGGVRLTEEHLEGELRGPEGKIRWDLRYRPEQGPLVPFPSPRMYEGPFPRSKLVSPAPDARFHGWYEVDGARQEVDGWRGMQGHNWGTSHAYRYAWAHCNLFDGQEEVIFEGLTGQIKMGPVVTPPITLLCLRVRGVRYDWNRPQDWLRTRAHTGLRRWEFQSQSDLGEIAGWIEAPTEDLVGLTYENPAGPTTYCLNSKLARAELRFQPTGRPAVRLCSSAAALEFGTTDPGHGVRMYL